jgi:hypothetical protein
VWRLVPPSFPQLHYDPYAIWLAGHVAVQPSSCCPRPALWRDVFWPLPAELPWLHRSHSRSGSGKGLVGGCFPSTDLLPDKDPVGTQWIKSVGAGALGTTPVSGNFGFAHTVEHGYTMLHPQEQRDSALPVTTGRFLRAVGRGKWLIINWLPPRDSNPDMLIQRLPTYHSPEFHGVDG